MWLTTEQGTTAIVINMQPSTVGLQSQKKFSVMRFTADLKSPNYQMKLN